MSEENQSNNSKEIILRVSEARPRDTGKRRVRIDVDIMKQLNVEPGDIVEIEGKKKTVAVVWPALPEDQGLDIIRMDGILRKNADINIGDKVIVRKAIPKQATKVKLAPTVHSISVDEGFKKYVKKKLVGTPVIEGDVIVVPVIGQAVQLTVIDTRPRGIVIISEKTSVDILEKPMTQINVPKVTYEDIGGLREVVSRIRELVELPLRHPELFARLGIEPPKGVLLFGPPGTGKTLLAKAVATESDAYFVAINGPEIMSKFYGESEQRLREIFEEAKKNAPAIIFIDEIDAIAPKRDEVVGEVERRVVAQLLALMDGLENRGQVIVIGATNRPNAVDPALRRPGRFDREIEVPLPDKQGRLEILQIHTRHMPLDNDVDMERLSEITKGYTGADLAALVKEAAMHALRRYLPEIDIEQEKIPVEVLEKMVVTMEDFISAFKEITPSGLREIQVEIPEVHWEDIGGLDYQIREVKETVELPLLNPELFKKVGIEPPKGILLVGPPGTGKTLLAKAVAHNTNATFIRTVGSELVRKYIGEGARLVRELFDLSREKSPSILFIDEIDAIGSRRLDMSTSGDREVQRTLMQLLAEMDGFDPLGNVKIIAATNRPDILDEALIRPGRFDRIIEIPMPNQEAREKIFKIHTKKMNLRDVDFKYLAETTQGMSGADIKAICTEAGMNAIRENRDYVIPKDFAKAIEKVSKSTKGTTEVPEHMFR
ncbi:CDC48 family AAA ATPase [Caldisphaera sp.]|uniref:CDC48 family AAA ATPase n=1 Tax=Caldisphaera sp. TaxID=2060322 RepID=UPI0025C3B978|nr:CDC48 family AAA ATPase [Caldisphaera sp.]